jgi:hypothetical protein
MNRKFGNTHNIIYSTNAGVMIGGIVGGLVILGVIVTAIFCCRKRQVAELDLEAKPTVLESSSTDSGSLRRYPLMPFADAPSRPYASSSSSRREPLRSLTHTSLKISPTSTHQSPASNSSAHCRAHPGDTQQCMIPPPLPPIPSVSPSRGANPKRQRLPSNAYAQGNASNVQLTDEQVDFVRGLWRANVPAAAIARVIGRMRAGEAASGEGLGGDEMNGGMHPSTAPPRYDAING